MIRSVGHFPLVINTGQNRLVVTHAVELFDGDCQRLIVNRLAALLTSNQIKLTLNLECFSLDNPSKDRSGLNKGKSIPQTLERYQSIPQTLERYLIVILRSLYAATKII